VRRPHHPDEQRRKERAFQLRGSLSRLQQRTNEEKRAVVNGVFFSEASLTREFGSGEFEARKEEFQREENQRRENRA
jgi:hypothetical protein